MTSPHLPAREPQDRPQRLPRPPRWIWVAAAGLAAGLVAGGAIVSLLDINGNQNARIVNAASPPSPELTAAPSANATSQPTLTFSQGCLRAISDAAAVDSELSALAAAAKNLDAAALDVAVRRLQTIEQSLTPSIRQCKATASIPSLPSAIPTPSSSPSAQPSR